MEDSMMTTPTPEEAQRTLHDIADVKQQTAAAAASPRSWYIACGVLAAGLGALADLAPGFSSAWGNAIVVLLLIAFLARSNRWGGRRLRPRLRGSLASRLGLGVLGAVGILALTVGAMSLHVPHLQLWVGIGGGLLVALAGPWWQNRRLRRGAQL
jgi:hypothetical protein